MSDPALAPQDREKLVFDLITARRDVGTGLRAGNETSVREGRARVDLAKRALGERGTPWWTDGAPDLNRHLVRNTGYADCYADLGTTAKDDEAATPTSSSISGKQPAS